MSRAPSEHEVQLARLIARSAAGRKEIGEQFGPVRRIDTGLEWLAKQKTQLPAIALGAGIGLAALKLTLRGSRSSFLRGGAALLHLAGSVKRLLSDRTTRSRERGDRTEA